MKNYRDFLLNEDFIQWRLFRGEEQNERWEQFRLANPHLEESLNEAINRFKALEMNRVPLPESEKDAIYTVVTRKIRKYKSRRHRRQISWSAIAAILVIAVLSTLFVRLHKENIPVLPAENSAIVGQALPGEDIYLLSGSEKINIANQSDIQLQKDAKVLITSNNETGKELALNSAKMNSLVVPFGKQSTLMLVDGTKIYLNSGTRVDFPSEFNGKTREIHVDGEIFIEVTEDAKKPFIVHTDRMDIQVLGTSFNVSAYCGDEEETVVLVEGRVSIKTAQHVTEMLPNEKVELAKDQVSKETVDVSEYISWTKGILEFDETSISDILKKVGRYYNVQFESSPGIPLNSQTCSGKLFLSNSLDSVMTALSVLSSTDYRRENNIIYITKK
ncbi:MAG: FecR family protein [Fermentimonas sp.]